MKLTTRKALTAALAFCAILALAVLPSLTPTVEAGSSRPAVGQTTVAYVASVAAATATQKDPLFACPIACKITRISVVPQAASTGDNSNTKNLNVLLAGATGVGTTEIANIDLVTGTDLVALDEKNIPLNTTYAAGANMSEGDVLALQTEKVGTGVTVGPMLVQVEWIPR